jgi:hypothetical protein
MENIRHWTEEIGYKIGNWYMVEIDYNVFIPAKFIGIRPQCPFRGSLFHNFPHPEAVFENVKLYNSCGFIGADWDSTANHGRGAYRSFRPKYRPVTESELWAVKAIEEFQKIIASRKKSFTIVLPNGFRFVGKVIPPKRKDNLPGKYYAELVNPKTGKRKEGWFMYDGKSNSVQEFLLSKLPGWQVLKLEQLEVTFGLLSEKQE